MEKNINIGIVGTGSFATFAAQVFLNIEGVSIVAVSDINKVAGNDLAKNLNTIFYNNYQELVRSDKVDLVYISTPPYLHYEISQYSLRSGKHVICEKPAALKTSEAEELQQIAKENNLLYVVNLMQRYNPLYSTVQKIIDEKLLGNFLHGFFENYASDEFLDQSHWFWDQSKSGGIFIEHGVHFFDMFNGWLGKGEVVSALEIRREAIPTNIFDRVQTSIIYKKGVVNFYHGFDQPKILDRQEMRLQFERGDITLYGWVPIKIKIHGVVSNEVLEIFKIILDNPSIIYHNGDDQKTNIVKGKFRDISYHYLVTIESGSNDQKQERYQQLLGSMLSDQIAWINNRSHIRKIDDNNAVESLRMAENAKSISQIF